MKTYSTGALPSPYDIRTFKYSADKASDKAVPLKGGKRWEPKDIEDQHSTGICTAISMVMNAQKHYGIRFSPEFQYLMQKRLYDKDYSIGWGEGSSIFHALKVGKNVGFLPIEEWTYTTENDRKLSYSKYIKKLRDISDDEVEEMVKKASKYKIRAYAKNEPTLEDKRRAIYENGPILSRFVVGSAWWTQPIEPLKWSANPSGGHAVNECNYDGQSLRLANSWGDWADKGTAYYLWNEYRSTESWSVWYEDVPKEIDEQLEQRKQVVGQILDYIQKIIVLLNKLI